ncbi:hypothetical protein AAG570_003906 [Ranatra chinensis]|uniref:Uncharacterized protein n=1 Tax=Ranatra chinensis TaxID=642074 RepID=A0ABD0Y2B9_9HEMI
MSPCLVDGEGGAKRGVRGRSFRPGCHSARGEQSPGVVDPPRRVASWWGGCGAVAGGMAEGGGGSVRRTAPSPQKGRSCAVGSTLLPGKFPFLSRFVPFKEGPWPGLRSARRAASRPYLREINAATPGLTRLARRLFRPRDGPLARVRDAGSPWLQ